MDLDTGCTPQIVRHKIRHNVVLLKAEPCDSYLKLFLRYDQEVMRALHVR